MSDLPEISILVPVWKRQNFLPLLVMNLKSQIYPHSLLTVVIDDDTEQSDDGSPVSGFEAKREQNIRKRGSSQLWGTCTWRILVNFNRCCQEPERVEPIHCGRKTYRAASPANGLTRSHRGLPRVVAVLTVLPTLGSNHSIAPG